MPPLEKGGQAGFYASLKIIGKLADVLKGDPAEFLRCAAAVTSQTLGWRLVVSSSARRGLIGEGKCQSVSAPGRTR